MPPIPDVPDAGAALLADLLARFGPLPPWAGPAIGLAGEAALVLTVLCWLPLWAAARDAGARTMAAVLAVPVAVVATWAAGEAVKQVMRVDRPCRLLPSFPAWADCAAPGDWSFPSNHAAIAGALVVGVGAAAWRLRRPGLLVVVLLGGTTAALSRVLSGAHFPHDVVVGAVLGGMVAVVTVLVSAGLLPGPVRLLRTRDRARPVLGPARTPRRG